MTDAILLHKEIHGMNVVVENQNSYPTWLDKGFI